jgi:hypothetical protein
LNSPKEPRREGHVTPCGDEAGSINFFPLHIHRLNLFLLRQRRGAAGNGLGITAKYLRRRTSSAAGSGLSTKTKYLRGAKGVGLGTTAN